MQHIETVTLSASQSSITFSSIPQDFTDLVVTVSARSTANESIGGAKINFLPNGSTADANSVILGGNGSAASSNTSASITGRINGSESLANTFGSGSFYFSNYTSANSKSVSSESLFENNETFARAEIMASLWSNSSVISSLVMEPEAGSFAVGTTLSLYGITAGSDGTTTVS